MDVLVNIRSMLTEEILTMKVVPSFYSLKLAHNFYSMPVRKYKMNPYLPDLCTTGCGGVWV